MAMCGLRVLYKIWMSSLKSTFKLPVLKSMPPPPPPTKKNKQEKQQQKKTNTNMKDGCSKISDCFIQVSRPFAQGQNLLVKDEQTSIKKTFDVHKKYRLRYFKNKKYDDLR